jgi:hypothetical protein
MAFNDQENHSRTQGSSRNPADVILQICPPGKTMRQLAAVIRNLTAGVASLEVISPLALTEWEGFKGQGGRLRVLDNETGGLINFPGKVVQVRYFSRVRDKRLLGLDLLLDQHSAAAQKVLNEYLPNRPRDIQELWERWDQARQPSAPRTGLTTHLGFVGVTMLFCGLILHTGGGEPHPLLGWMCWLIGTLGVLGQILLLWRGIKDSS